MIRLVVGMSMFWEHPKSGCVLTLPKNNVDEPPRPGDVVGIRTQLDMHGHLDEMSKSSTSTSLTESCPPPLDSRLCLWQSPANNLGGGRFRRLLQIGRQGIRGQ